MKIVAFSDSHACGKPSAWSSLFDKRSVGLFNYHYRRKHKHNSKWLHDIVEYILKTKPDVVICTGDITTSGEPSEFNETCDILKPLVNNSDFDFYYVPGNHDCYVKDPTCVDAVRKAFLYLNSGKYKFSDMPFSVSYKDIDFCFVCECLPVNLVLSIGKMTKATESYIDKWVKTDTSKPKILVGHYPLIEDHPVLRFRHSLWGYTKVVSQLLKEKKLSLSLCGHVHWPTAKIDDKGRGEIIIGSVTANACGALIEYDKMNDSFSYNKIDLKKL